MDQNVRYVIPAPPGGNYDTAPMLYQIIPLLPVHQNASFYSLVQTPQTSYYTAPTSFQPPAPPTIPSEENKTSAQNAIKRVRQNNDTADWKKRKLNKHLKNLETEIEAKYLLRVRELGNSPEDIQAWRNERKARFPTRQRIEDSKLNDGDVVIASSNEVPVVLERKVNSRVCATFLKGSTCKFGESCKYSHDPELKEKMLLKRRANIKEKRSKNEINFKSSVAEKLFQNERLKEEFVLLEIVKYLCETNFMEDVTPSA